jgi:hypothetical protein
MKFDFKSVLTRNLLPGMSGSAGGDPTARGRGTPFTFYHARDTKEVFFSDAEGNLINLGSLIASVLDGSTPLAFPAQGCAGRDGAPGRDGADGKSGRDGANSTVPGPASTVPGPQGPPGQSIRGEQGPPGPDTASVLAEVRQALAELRGQVAPLTAQLHRYLQAKAGAEEFRIRTFASRPTMFERVPKK